MGANYQVNVYNPQGVFLIGLQVSSLTLALQENQEGSLAVTVPPIRESYPAYLREDSIIEVVRTLGIFSEVVGNVAWLVRRVRYGIDDDGLETVEITGYDPLNIIKRRIIAYQGDSAYTNKIDFADDMMKDIVNENFGALAIDAERDASAWLSVLPATSEGPIVSFKMEWRTISDALNDIANNAEEEGTRIIYSLERGTRPGLFVFKTYKNYRGTDHTEDAASPVHVGHDFGNLSAPELIYDYSEEVNTAYVGGQGSDQAQVYEVVKNDTRIAVSPYNRCETYISGGNTIDVATLQSLGKAALAKGRPRLIFDGVLLDSPDFQYGINFRYGDLVTAHYHGISLDCALNTLNIQFDQDNGEQIELRMHGEALLA